MSEVIRILHVLGGMGQGGTENFLMNLYRNIDKEKIQFDFLVNREGFFDDEIERLGGRIYYIPALQKVGQISYVSHLKEFLLNHKEYKIIHSHLNQVTGLILEVANKVNIPIRIAHSHNSKSNKHLIIKIYKKYLGNKIVKNATDLWACSDIAGNWLYGKNTKNVKIIKNAIDLEKFEYSEKVRNKVRKDFNIEEKDFVIGNIGRFSYQKNQIFLLEVLKELKNINKNTKLMLVGNGSLKEKLIKHSKELNIEDSIIWLENRTDVNELLQAMDFFVFPSKFEGLGIVLIEAQSAGLKCIASEKVIPKEAQVTRITKILSFRE